MPIRLDDHVTEEGVFLLVCTFEDEDGASLAPTAITWTLRDPDGGIVNARQDVAVAVPATSVTITLQGSDLSMISGQTNERAFLLEWTYNSTYGTGLSNAERATFIIDDL